MVDVALGRLEPEVVQAHLLARGAERDTDSACVCPRVKSAEPCVRGRMPTSIEIGRISVSERPSGRFLWTAIRWRMVSFSSLSNAACALER